jgi:hypothetical protein
MKIRLVFLAFTTVLAASELIASELRVENEPETTERTKGALKVAEKRAVYYRQDKLIAAIVDETMELKPAPPTSRRLLRFYITKNAWVVEVDLKKRRVITVRSGVPILVNASDGSVSVVCPEQGYCETFFFEGAGTFYDGPEREKFCTNLIERASTEIPDIK